MGFGFGFGFGFGLGLGLGLVRVRVRVSWGDLPPYEEVEDEEDEEGDARVEEGGEEREGLPLHPLERLVHDRGAVRVGLGLGLGLG